MKNESVIYLESIKKGDKLKIYCYKHDGSLEHTSNEAIVLEENEEMLICGNGKTKITEKDGRSHMTNEPAILFFYKKNWFNIIGQLKKHGLYYYCNIASPYILEDGIIKYIDYDLDLRVFPNGSFKVLDRGEYKYHKKIMNYPNIIDKILKYELSNLIEKVKKKEIPFKEGMVEYYCTIYKTITLQN